MEMAADKAWTLWRRRTMEERWRRDGQGRRCRQTVSFVSGRLHRGGSREDQPRKKGSDLTQAGLSEGTLYAPVYHALKGGHAGPFEVPDHPAGSLKTCRRWTFMPLAESYSIFIHLLMCIFWGRDSKKRFYASHSSWGKDHKQSSVCRLSFYCDVLIWHCWPPEEQEVAQRAGGWI